MQKEETSLYLKGVYDEREKWRAKVNNMLASAKLNKEDYLADDNEEAVKLANIEIDILESVLNEGE